MSLLSAETSAGLSFPDWGLPTLQVSPTPATCQAKGSDEHNWSLQDLEDLSDCEPSEGAVTTGQEGGPSGAEITEDGLHPELTGVISASSSTASLPSLPASVLEGHITCRLSCKDLAQVLMTCRSWHSAAAANEAWSHLASALQKLHSGDQPMPPAAASTASVQTAGQPLLEEVLKGGGVVIKRRRLVVSCFSKLFCDQILAVVQHTGSELGQSSFQSPVGLNRHVVKTAFMAERKGAKFVGLRRPHDDMRLALCTLWIQQEACDVGPLRRAMLQLTRLHWNWTYEALGAGFVHVADACALQLHTMHRQQQAGASSGAGSSGTTRLRHPDIWRGVLAAWRLYNAWLHRVLSVSGLLAECVSAERSAEMMSGGRGGRADTPQLYDAGRAAFRSQVILAYELREPLQQALVDAALARSRDAAPDWLVDAGRLLHILDVMDDATSPAVTHTQAKLRQVFGMDADGTRLHAGHASAPLRRRTL